MKVLFVAPVYHYGKKEEGLSFEELHLAKSMEDAEIEVERFDYLSKIATYGQQIANEYLRTEFANGYDLAIYVPFSGDEIYQNTWKFCTVPKVLWMFNDDWRFDDYSIKNCWNFNWVITDHEPAVQKYNFMGFGKNVIYLPRLARTEWFNPVEKDIDLCFIGEPHSNRVELVNYIIKNVPANTRLYFGNMGRGRVPWKDYIEILGRSKISLCFCKAARGDGYQTKTRVFESAASKALIFTDNQELKLFKGLEIFSDRDYISFSSQEDMIDRLKEYLVNNEARNKIAESAYNKVMKSRLSYSYQIENMLEVITKGVNVDLCNNRTTSI